MVRQQARQYRLYYRLRVTEHLVRNPLVKKRIQYRTILIVGNRVTGGKKTARLELNGEMKDQEQSC